MDQPYRTDLIVCSPDYKPDLAVAEARSYIGRQWSHRARGPYRIDCVGLVVASVRAGGVEMRDRRDYGREPKQNGMDREMYEHFGEPVAREDWRPGDVAMLRWENINLAGHCGIIASNHGILSLIHSHSMSVVIEHDIDDYWRRMILGVFRP